MTSVACQKPKPNQYDVRYLSGMGYAVFGPDGRRVSTWYRDRAIPEAMREQKQREADERKKRGPRTCLCCSATFQSEGIHNRLCVHCRARATA